MNTIDRNDKSPDRASVSVWAVALIVLLVVIGFAFFFMPDLTQAVDEVMTMTSAPDESPPPVAP